MALRSRQPDTPPALTRALRSGAVRCGALRCGAVRCGAVRCGAGRGYLADAVVAGGAAVLGDEAADAGVAELVEQGLGQGGGGLLVHPQVVVHHVLLRAHIGRRPGPAGHGPRAVEGGGGDAQHPQQLAHVVPGVPATPRAAEGRQAGAAGRGRPVRYDGMRVVARGPRAGTD